MKVISFIFLLSLSTRLAAQNFKTALSETYDNKAAYGNIVALTNTHLHLLRTQKGAAVNMSVEVRKTDIPDRTVLGETKDALKIREPLGVKFIKAGGSVYIVYQEMDKKGNAGNIMAAEVDTNTLAILPARVIGNMQAAGYEAKVNMDNFRFYRFYWIMSPDKQSIVTLINNDKNAAEFYVAVFDDKLALKWDGKHQLNAASSDVKHQDVTIDNKGNVYVAYRLLSKGKSEPGGRIAIYNNNKSVKELSFDLGGSTPNDIKLYASANSNKVHVAGFYFEKNYLALQGAYMTSVNNPDLTLSPMRKEVFPAAIVSQLSADGWATSKAGDKYGVAISLGSKLFELDNYQPVITGEFTSRDLSMSNNVYHYSGSILATYFSIDKVIFTRLPKYRVSTASLVGASYSAFAWGDKLVIFYNDNSENLRKDISDKPASSTMYNNVIMVGAIIKPNGDVSRHTVIDLKKENFVAITDKIQRKGNQFIVPNYQVKALGGINDNFRLATIDILE